MTARAASPTPRAMDPLTAFGLFAVAFTLLCYMLEARGRIWVLLFAVGCVMGSAYGFLQGAWPFGVIELFWAAAALYRWWQAPRGDRAMEPIA